MISGRGLRPAAAGHEESGRQGDRRGREGGGKGGKKDETRPKEPATKAATVEVAAPATGGMTADDLAVLRSLVRKVGNVDTLIRYTWSRSGHPLIVLGQVVTPAFARAFLVGLRHRQRRSVRPQRLLFGMSREPHRIVIAPRRQRLSVRTECDGHHCIGVPLEG